jgi:predicted nucleic acid-binding protein
VDVDTAPVIYTVEKHMPYLAMLWPLWESANRLSIVTSELAAMECLVKPIRMGDAAIRTEWESFLFAEGLDLLPIGIATLLRAAEIRAGTGLKTPDAIHAATALEAGCTLFITNDSHFRRVPGLNAIVLEDLLSE